MISDAAPAPHRRSRFVRRAVVSTVGLIALTAGGVAAASAPPVDPPVAPLGSSRVLDGLVAECAGGDLRACDQLFRAAPVGSDYEDYGDTCGGRQPAGTSVLCIEAEFAGTGTPGTTAPATTAVPVGIPDPTIEPVDLGDDPAFDLLAQQCYDGDMEACDTLYRSTAPLSDYRSFADSCAGRQGNGSGNWCADSFPADAASVATAPATTAPDATETTAPDTAAPSNGGVTISTMPSGDVPAPTIDPNGLGTDAEMNALAAQCYAGDLESCDDLYRTAFGADATSYVEYADSCAGRQPTDSGRWCVELASGTTTSVGTSVAETVPETVPVDTTVTGTVAPGEIPEPTLEPIGLGDDPTLNALAEACFDGDLSACDELFDAALGPDLGAYSTYADTCAGRQPAGSGRWCTEMLGDPVDPGPGTDVLPPDGLGNNPRLDSLAEACYVGDMESCDELFRASPFRSDYETYGDTCAGRQPAGTFRYCTATFPDGV